MILKFLLFLETFHFSYSATASNHDFPEWENNFITFIRDGGDVFEDEANEQEEIPERQEEFTSDKLPDFLSKLKALKQYALDNENYSLYASTQKNIQELEWLISSGKNLVQGEITSFFPRM